MWILGVSNFVKVATSKFLSADELTTVPERMLEPPQHQMVVAGILDKVIAQFPGILR